MPCVRSPVGTTLGDWPSRRCKHAGRPSFGVVSRLTSTGSRGDQHNLHALGFGSPTRRRGSAGFQPGPASTLLPGGYLVQVVQVGAGAAVEVGDRLPVRQDDLGGLLERLLLLRCQRRAGRRRRARACGWRSRWGSCPPGQGHLSSRPGGGLRRGPRRGRGWASGSWSGPHAADFGEVLQRRIRPADGWLVRFVHSSIGWRGIHSTRDCRLNEERPGADTANSA